VVVTGVWQGTWQSSLDNTGSVSATLTQTGTALAGTMTVANSPCFGPGTVIGIINDIEITLSVTFPAQRISFSGETNGRGAMTGQYAVTIGSCVDGNSGGMNLSLNQ